MLYCPDISSPENGSKSISIYLYSRGRDYIIRTELPVNRGTDGAGDLAAALILGHVLPTDSDQTALENTTNSVYAVLEQTLRANSSVIQIVAARNEIMRPPDKFTVSEITV